ncbi:hypothetical protein LWI28_014801 [Acer negundo]|uniref:Prolamin-like domain-containing protein n=1 Tax=Acer negundo TaxID=4023 RepID=A0AAD5IJE1_ACENE|nr:hypothetical protein LWI28_014801 [Acer negundo]
MHPKSQEISTALLCTLVECWNALLEVKSCSNEIILFFLNGQANIGSDCCRSIAIITRNACLSCSLP